MGKEIYVEDRMTQIKMYSIYVEEHIERVQQAYKILRPIFLKDILNNVPASGSTMNILDDNIKNHDRSKYSIEEFDAYAKRFYPIEGTNPRGNEYSFNVAWLHHIHNNAHHPNHWVLYDDKEIKILDMPDIYIIEMLCDWIAMSWYHNTDLKDYWKSDSCRNLPMSDQTRSKTYDTMMYIYAVMQIDNINELKQLIQ